MPDEQKRDEELTPEQVKTLEILDASGFTLLISELKTELMLVTFDDLSGIPLPVDAIFPLVESIDYSSEVREKSEYILAALKDPDTALEIPFCLMGTCEESDAIKLKNISFLFNNFSSLRNTSVDFDPNKLSEAVDKLGNAGVFVIAHTHPLISEDEKQRVLTSKISPETKKKFGIKDIGLNLSLQDIFQLVTLREQLSSNIRVILGVYMFNGEKVFVEIQDGKLVRLTQEDY